MHINQVKIENFKGLKRFEFQPGKNFTIIIGDNGSGKSSILEAISVGLSAILSPVEGVQTVNFNKDEIRRVNEPLGDGSINIKYKLPVAVTLDTEIDGEAYTIHRHKTSFSAHSTVEPRKALQQKMSAMINDSDSTLPVLAYQNAGRMWCQKREKWVNVFARNNFSRAIGYLDCLDLDGINNKLLTKWFERMELISWQQNKKIGEYESVKNAATRFISSIEGINTASVFYDKQNDEIAFNDGNNVLPIRLLSAGYRTLLGMVLDIAYRMSVLNPNKKENASIETDGIVLIDEIDVHIHPKWQWRIINALRNTFPRVQFIATTHSPLVISSCENVRLVQLSGESTTLTSPGQTNDVSTTIKGWQVDDVLQKIMGAPNRDPETTDLLNELQAISKKRIQEIETSSDIERYDFIVDRLKSLLPEDDNSVNLAGLWSLSELLKD